MEKFSKKTLLNYVNGAGLFGAAPSGTSVVKFAWASTLQKIGTGGDGTITFYADTTNGSGLVLVGDQVVSSKIMDLAWAQSTASGAKTGEKVVTLKYISGLGENAVLNTVTLDVIDKVAAKAIIEDYFTNSNTIAITGGTADVLVDSSTILIDSTNKYLKSGLKIAYVAETATTGSKIQLQDAHGAMLSEINVGDIVGDGVLVGSIYHDDTGILELRFGNGRTYDPENPDTYTAVNVDLKKVIDWNDFLIGSQSADYLGITPSADSSVITLNTKMQDPSTASDNATGLADAWKVKQYVDSKTTDLAVSASGDNYVDASVDANDKKHINVVATDKTKTAVALAETAVQSVVEGTSVEGYVALNVSAKSDASVVTITTDDSALSAKLTEIDGSIGDISTRLANKTAEIDSSIDRLDSSVSVLEATIAGLDITKADDALDGSISVSVTQTDGLITAVELDATKATVTFDNTGATPNLTSGSGLLAGDAIAPIKNYVDAVAQKGFDGLDSEVEKKDSSNFIGYKVGIVDGKLLDSSCSLTAVFGDYDATSQTDGLATTGATKTYIDSEIQSLDLANDVTDASASDAAGFVKTVISETDGIVKNESVTVTYGDYGTHANGIAKTADTSVFVEEQITAALTWQQL